MPLRRAGRQIETGGRVVTWSVAEGSRGRRWRWTVADRQGRLVVAHTLELDPEGRFTKLESATAGALLTLHREADGSIHGNRVVEGGVDHLTVPAPAPDVALAGAAAVAVAAIAPRLGSGDKVGETIEALEVLDDLGLRVVDVEVRQGANGLELRTAFGNRRAALDAEGLPAGAGTTSWPLELG